MSGKHIPALDGLRGVAVLGVVAHHLDVLRGGYLGVDAFFVLSGFLITGLLVDEAAAASPGGKQIDLGGFWARRARRLLPALGVLLLVVVVVERWVLDVGQRSTDLRSETIATVAYVFNWQQISAGVDYWSAFDAPSSLRHMWSLAIEEQFYLLWPLVVLAAAWWARRRGWRLVTVIGWSAIGGAVVSVAWSQRIFDPRDSLRSYYGTDVRVAAVLFGATAAMLVRVLPRTTPASQRRLAGAGLIAVVPIAWAWGTLDGQSEALYRGGLVATGIGTAFVMFAAVQAPTSMLSRALSFRTLCWFGTISYGLYLWHWPIIVWLTPERVGVDGWRLLVIRVAVTMTATLLSFWLIEQPIRRAQWSGRQTFRWSVAAVAGLFVVATVGASSTTFERVEAGTRDTTPIPTLAPTATPALTTTTTTVTASLPAEPMTSAPTTSTTTTTTAPVSAPLERLLVVGDSGAYFLGQPLAALAADVVVVQRGQVGCGVLTSGGGVHSPLGFIQDAAECASFPDRLRRDVEEFQPTHVLFVYGWPGTGERDIDQELVGSCDPAFAEAFARQLTALTTVGSSTGARSIVADVPYFVTALGLVDDRASTDCLNDIIRSTVQPSDLLSIADWTCPEGVCRERADGELLRPDGLHFEGPGGVIAAEWIIDSLRSLPG